MSGDDDEDEPGGPVHSRPTAAEPFRRLVEIPQAAPAPERPAKLGLQPVGYGRPPVEHRFKPGQSGNPAGRKLGSKNKLAAGWGERMRGIVREEAYREITVRDGDEPVTIPMAQAVMRSVAVNAAKGQPRAQRLFLELVSAMEAEEVREHKEYVLQGLEYKTRAEQEIARRKRQGLTDVSDIVPHPDDIVIDLQAGTLRVEGPMTSEQKDAWTSLIEHQEALQRLIDEQRDRLRRQRKPESRALTQRLIDVAEQQLVELKAVMPDWVLRD